MSNWHTTVGTSSDTLQIGSSSSATAATSAKPKGKGKGKAKAGPYLDEEQQTLQVDNDGWVSIGPSKKAKGKARARSVTSVISDIIHIYGNPNCSFRNLLPRSQRSQRTKRWKINFFSSIYITHIDVYLYLYYFYSKICLIGQIFIYTNKVALYRIIEYE